MSEIHKTEAQEKAIKTLDRDVFLSAGAGTGKTLVLTEHYLHILREKKCSVAEILAITFTNKAAYEMRQRIYDRCLEASESNDGEEAAFWKKIRHDLDGARIGTIHSMCSAILREHPVQAGCDPAFHVGDEGVSSILLGETVAAAIESMLARKDPDLLTLIDEYGLKATADLTKKIIRDESKFSRASALLASKTDDELAAHWLAALDDCREEALSGVLNSGEWRKGEAVLRNNHADDPSDTLDKKRADFLALIDRLKDKSERGGRFRLVDELLKIKAQGGSKEKWDKEEKIEEVRHTISAAKEMLKKGLSLFTKMDEDVGRAVALARAAGAVCRQCLEEFRAQKEQRGALSFDDLQIKVRDLLIRDEALRRSIRRRTRFILVDEFQDISPIQKEIIFLLAGRNESKEKTRAHLLVVGDAKQSIYRFRGADVTVFNSLKESMSGEGEALVARLDKNFRSSADLVALFNRIFSSAMPPLDSPPAYYAAHEAAVAHRGRGERGCCAELLVTRFHKGAEDVSAQRDFEARAVAARIRELVDGGECKFGDVAVLLRKFQDRSSIFEGAFREYRIPYNITAGSGFYGREEIADLIGALRVAENPFDDFSLLCVLRSPMFALDDNTIFWLGRAEGARLWEKFQRFDGGEKLTPVQRERFERARGALAEMSKLARRLPLSGFFTKLLEETDYEAVLLAGFMGEQKISNVRKLIDVARGFEESGVLAAGDFVDYVNQLVTNEVRESEAVSAEEEGDAVKIMTIHKAKGLEFPVVFLPAIADSGGGGARPVAFADAELGIVVRPADGNGNYLESAASVVHKTRDGMQEDAEALRAFYVGATRAKDLLVMSATVKEDSDGNADAGETWLGAVLRALDIPLDPHEKEIELPRDDNDVAPRISIRVLSAEGASIPQPSEGAEKSARQVSVARALLSLAEKTPRAATPMLSRLQPDTAAKTAFRATDLATYDRCPRRYYYEVICGFPEKHEGAEAAAPKGVLAPTTFGQIAHEVFEKLDPASPPSRETIAEAVGAAAENAESAAGEIYDLVQKFLKTEICGELRNAKFVRRELPFLLRLNDAAIEGIIDLLYERPDGTLSVVDYKTDAVDEGDLAEHARRYEAQMAAYALAARKILKKEVASARLYFARHGRAVESAGGRECEERLKQIIADIRAGKFEKTSDTPCPCGYAWLCGQSK